VSAVAVTGVGLISAAGAGVEWARLAQASGVTALRPAPFGGGLVGQVAAPLPGVAPRAFELAAAAATEAVADAALPAEFELGVVVGTTQGALEIGRRLHRSDPAAITREAVETYRPGALADWLAARLGATGPVTTLGMACVSGASAIAYGADLLRRGLCEAVLAGGVDATDEFLVTGFRALGALSTGALRPFDHNRDGTVTGEAAAFVVLERAPRAEPRGWLLGAGNAADAVHPTAPDRTGSGLARAIEASLKAAGCDAGAVDLVCAHGTGTPHNDPMECAAFERVFGEAVPPVIGAKGVFGHTLGAAGAVDLLWTLLALETQRLPATVGHTEPLRPPPWDFVPRSRAAEPDVALSTNSAFVGNNVALLVGRSGQAGEPESPPLLSPREAPTITGIGMAPPGPDGTRPVSRASHPHAPKSKHGFLMDAFSRDAFQAAGDALAAAGVAPGDPTTGVALGTAFGCHAANFEFDRYTRPTGPGGPSAKVFAATVHSSAAGWTAIRYGLRGPNMTFCGGVGADLEAIDHAARLIANGDATRMVTGGVERLPAAYHHLHGGGAGAAVVVLDADHPLSGPKICGLVRGAGSATALLEAALAPLGADLSDVAPPRLTPSSRPGDLDGLPHQRPDTLGAAGAFALADLLEDPIEAPFGVVHARRAHEHLMLLIARCAQEPTRTA